MKGRENRENQQTSRHFQLFYSKVEFDDFVGFGLNVLQERKPARVRGQSRVKTKTEGK
jgi:hypothetical protein